MRGERDACGIGFVADSSGRSSRAIVVAALDALCNVKHRGAVAADALTGDGAGLLVPLRRSLVAAGAGAAMVFADPTQPSAHREIIEDASRAEGIEVRAWRPVPVRPDVLGDRARDAMPHIEQAILALRDDSGHAERRAHRARKRAERAARSRGLRLYIASASFDTITYKALCAADQLAAFYPDLADGSFEASFALFHQRYSTNTTPTWERAQPFRLLAHNGEINTIRGNVARMRAREGNLGAEDKDAETLLRPVVDESGSDSAILDEALELLTRSGRDVLHAATMLVPPAWEASDLDDRVRAFLRYHACLVEPWDGPAGLVFTDGRRVGAALDRNGLRPLRVAICEDGFVACCSEAGAVSLEGHGRVRRTRLGPGEMLCVDPATGVLEDAAIKSTLAAARPYGEWLRNHLVDASPGAPVTAAPADVVRRQVAAGYTKEEFTVVVRPMATGATEPTSSMGDDTAQPPLARVPRSVFSFLKQRFAQVTNPPIDHLRERDVMSITTRLGAEAPLLSESPAAARVREYPTFILFPSAVQELEELGGAVIDATFDVVEGPDGLEVALRRLGADAAAAVRSGAPYLVVSDRAAGAERAPIPSALAAGAIHHALVAEGVRARTSIIADCDDVRETHHAACLLTNGTDAVCPRLAFESIADLAATGRLGGNTSAADAQCNFVTALEDGLLKVMSKMGISTLNSYRGAQIIEAVGLGDDVIDACFKGISSPLSGLSLLELGADVINRHAAAYGASKPALTTTGFVKFKRGGEFHALNPDVIDALHDAVGVGQERELEAAHELRRAVRGDPAAYARFAAIADGRDPSEPRDLLDFHPAGPPLSLADVESAAAIATRFSSGAMSHGALSAEAHETVAIALNMLGAAANSGEGGEAPERYATERNCRIKQVASGRFGVTPGYVAGAHELQIKIAQGSKPGEGGQLPGKKVSVEIARLRHTVPGVALISPPPHHDIYSIEDLAQLIFDLKQANPHAYVSVKLVSSEGVGTIAAGVVKGLADVVHIAGADGGTGASPLSSIKNAGMPWETGLADAHGALVANDLRGRARLRVDGGFKTGRDVIAAALLGADEYSFGTALLVAEGCILVRTCHRNTCPVGIATQDPLLRAKFAGTPEMVATYLLMIADEVRTHLASLGLASLDEAVGRTDLLSQKRTGDARADSLDVSPLLARPTGERRFTGSLPVQRPRSDLGDRLCSDALDGVLRGERLDLAYEITNADRTVGARLGCEIERRFAPLKPPGRARARFRGAAGQTFGAFLAEAMDFVLEGEANDYVGKGMAGGRIVIKPPRGDAGNPVLAGNTVLYGATGGRLFVAGRAGERFAVRNSGAIAVVEGVGDHACEYMTAGAVVVLGPVGNNFGAGMSGGEAYVYDPGSMLERRLNPQLVAAYDPSAAQLESLRRVILRHFAATGSEIAARLLGRWAEHSLSFRRVAPVEEIARLEALFEGTAVSAA